MYIYITIVLLAAVQETCRPNVYYYTTACELHVLRGALTRFRQMHHYYYLSRVFLYLIAVIPLEFIYICIFFAKSIRIGYDWPYVHTAHSSRID